MRKVNWNSYKSKRASFLKTKASLGFKRISSSRIRDVEERRLLLQLDRARLESWKREGKLEILGPRKLRLNISAVK
ncbi:MAG: hypothetical protein QME63_03425 [Actinomycetota bacterium]|nr:hypothetical protein [Actinomycetota bacterium]